MDSYRDAVTYNLGLLNFISDIIYHDSTDSTNTIASGLAHAGAKEWTVVVADSQNNGRGRQGRVWHSPPNTNIYASFIVKPDISYEYFPAMSLLAGMVVALLIEQFTGMPTEIKWPNDVLIHDKKISGILLELGNDVDNRAYVVVGIGINVNADATVYPDTIALLSTSLMLLTGKVFDRAEMIGCLYSLFYKWYSLYISRPGFNSIREQFMQRFKMMGKQVAIVNGAETVSGVVKDIDNYGRLVIKDSDDNIVIVKSGDVHLVRTAV